MELTRATLARLRQIADLTHARNSADLARQLHRKAEAENRLADAQQRRGHMLPAGSADAGDLAAARSWTASSDAVSARCRTEIETMQPELEATRDLTRQSWARTEACRGLANDLDASERRTQQRVEERTALHLSGRRHDNGGPVRQGRGSAFHSK